jgi:hypothetical protein
VKALAEIMAKFVASGNFGNDKPLFGKSDATKTPKG